MQINRGVMEEKKPTVFKATNRINGKCFVGYTTKYEERIKQVRKNINASEKRIQSNSLAAKKLILAIREFGWENFSWEVLYQSNNIADSSYAQKIVQPEMIEKFDAYENGYNDTRGGIGASGSRYSEERLEKISLAAKRRIKEGTFGRAGVTLSKETKKRMSRSAKERWKEDPRRKYSERVEKMSKGWLITFPNGKEEKISNLKRFCRDNSLDSSSMRKVALKIVSHHRGFKCQLLD